MVCIFDKVFASFWHSTDKNLHKNKLHVKWHAHFRFWHVVVTCEEKTTRQLTLQKLKWHVLHWSDLLKENVNANWHLFLFLTMSRNTLNLKLNVNWNLSNIHSGHHLDLQTLRSNRLCPENLPNHCLETLGFWAVMPKILPGHWCRVLTFSLKFSDPELWKHIGYYCSAPASHALFSLSCSQGRDPVVDFCSLHTLYPHYNSHYSYHRFP